MEQVYEHHYHHDGSAVRSPIKKLKLIDIKNNKDLPEAAVKLENSKIPKSYRKMFKSPRKVDRKQSLIKLGSMSDSPFDLNSKINESFFSRINMTENCCGGSPGRRSGNTSFSFVAQGRGKSPVSSEKKSQKSNNSEVVENELCVICFANPQNAVYLPCGHGSTCIECSLDIFDSSDCCCICREIVQKVVEIDLNQKRNNCFRVVRSFIYFNEEHEGEKINLEQIHRAQEMVEDQNTSSEFEEEEEEWTEEEEQNELEEIEEGQEVEETGVEVTTGDEGAGTDAVEEQ